MYASPSERIYGFPSHRKTGFYFPDKSNLMLLSKIVSKMFICLRILAGNQRDFQEFF